MKLIKAIIPVLFAALATGFTACTDDDDYVLGQQSPGAYFEASLPDEVLIPMEGPSFEIEVNRTSADAPATYAITTDAPSCFKVPSTVTFNGDALTTKLVVSYNPAEVEQDKPYEVKFTVDPASNYGNATYAVTLLRSVPKKTIHWGGHATGLYTYTQFYLNGVGEYDVTWTYNPTEPTKDIVINVGPVDPKDPETLWHYYDGAVFPGLVLKINMPDTEKRLSNGCIPVFVDVQQINGDPFQNVNVAICDMATFYRDILKNDAGYEHYKDYSFYDPKTGQFSLFVLYCIPDQAGQVYSQGGYEYLNLAGFPNYEVDAVYKGIFKDAAGDYTVLAQIAMGSDVASVKTALVSAATESEAVDAVVSGKVEAQEIKAAGLEAYDVSYPVYKSGKYYIVVVSYDKKGEKQLAIAVPVTIDLGGGDSFRKIGQGSMIDGWILPAYDITTQDGTLLTPEDLYFPVEFGADAEDETLFYMINPFNNDEYPLTYLGANTDGQDRNLAFTLDGDYFALEPQLSGFGNVKSFGGEFTIGNHEGWIAQSNEGATKEQITEFMAQKGYERSTVEDGLITVPRSYWACPAKDNNQFGYAWTSWSVSYIGLPGTGETAMARAKAKAVANPKFATLTSRVAARAQSYVGDFGKLKSKRVKLNVKVQSIR